MKHTRKAPEAVEPIPAAVEAPAPRANLAGVTITPGTYKKPDCYRPFVRIRVDGIQFTKLVPGGRTATREEALTKAEAYRTQILAEDRLPPRPERFDWNDGDFTHRRPDGTLVTD
jgi:hypothetical protein